MFSGPEDSLARVEDDVRRAQARAAVLPRLQEEVAGVRARVLSRRRDIAVEVDSNGVLVGLEISDAAVARGGRAVSGEVMDLFARATREVRERTLAITEELLGADDPIVQLTAAQLDAESEGGAGAGDSGGGLSGSDGLGGGLRW